MTQNPTSSQNPQDAATEATEPAETQQDGTQTPEAPETPTEGTEDNGDERGKAGREAAKYRTQLRTVEAERDQLSETVASLQKGIIAQNMPEGSKAGAEALWTAGHAPAEFFKEDGTLNADALTKATKGVHEKFGLRFGPDTVTESGGREHNAGGYGVTWSDAFKA